MKEREPSGVQVLDDDELAHQLQEGQAEAVAVLFDRYGRLAYGLAYRMLTDAAAAEDVVQEAFVLAWKNARAFDLKRGSLRNWLMTIVRNRAVDRLRRARVRPTSQLDAGRELVEVPDVWEAVISQETRGDIKDAFDRLPEAQRVTLGLAYFGGYTHTEIAQRLNVPLGTVKGRMRMGLEKMRSFLQGRGVDG